ncbi:unnamed protein product [Tuber melanosporum]|uniref:(Perigord truffle) hypothetical protein n=1 Tax=Tuber melanosporum (strain Mel28) TaxID=656061 RepID=D5GJ57_TUBMM|nr:uncharacterized protein GSTUM_00008847001 [Tuber melanosporum]CAZ84550.1 unnamed protein product [Tuber melanosporum]
MTASVDPTRAITEEEPFQVNQSKQTSNLRATQFKDQYGNPIAEPDLSNPTRNRWERPLDTIRAFEDAIYKEHRRAPSYGDRRSGPSSETGNAADNQQQNHYDFHTRSNTSTPRNPHYDVYSGRSATPRSGMDGYGEPEAGYGRMNARSPIYNGRMSPRNHGHHQGYGYPQGPAGPPRPGHDRRQHYDPYAHGHRPNIAEGIGHPAHRNAPSPESYQSKPASNSSGPESDISHGSAGGPPAQPQPVDSYGFASGQGSGQPELFATSTQLYEPLSPGENWNAPKPNAPPTPPAEADQKAVPSPPPAQQPESNAVAEKRKSWFKRKMGKG